MTVELAQYVERRERCTAVRFQSLDQVGGIAELLVARNWTLTWETGRFSLVVTRGIPGTDQEETLTLNYGDFVVENGHFWYIVVPRDEFQSKFEPAAVPR